MTYEPSKSFCYTAWVHALLLTLSTLLIVAGGLIYCASIIRGRSKPHRTTRFVILVILALSFVSILAAHANLGAKSYSGILFFSAIAFLALSLKSGIGGWSVFDVACLVIALDGIVAWRVASNPIVAIWFAIVAYSIAYLPAFIKTWRQPYTESPWLYGLSALASFFSLIGYKIVAVSAFQIFAIVCSLAMLVCIYHKGAPQKSPAK